jgi:hypothetical protein
MKAIWHAHSWGRRRERHLEPGEWPSPTGRARVLIENPDAAELWAHADVLREAGFDVATCTGPTAPDRPLTSWAPHDYLAEDAKPNDRARHLLCPLVAGRDCPLVKGTDVVVTTTTLQDGRAIISALAGAGEAARIVEGPAPTIAKERDVIGDAAVIHFPVTSEALLAAVEAAVGLKD